MTTLTFPAGSNTVIGAWAVNGTPGDLVTVTSATAAPHFLVASSGFVYAYYLDLSYSSASPAETWYAIASVDSGNNTGWIFGAPEGDTYYIPEDFPDLPTALLAMSDGDTLVFHTSAAVQTNDITTALNFITLRAGEGYTPALDFTDAAAHGLELTGNGWAIEGVTFRSRDGGGGSALILTSTTGHTLTGLAFEGCATGISGGTFTLSQSTFRRVSTACISTPAAAIVEACLFLYTTGIAVSAALANVRNCTLVGCTSATHVVNAAEVNNNTAQACAANVGTGYIFRATGDVTHCNAFGCTGLGNFNAGGTASNNTTVDPLHVNLYTDVRLLPASPLIRAGTAGNAAETDYYGAAFQAPPTIGASESIVIASANATAADTVAVVLTGTYVEADVEAPASWTLSNDANGLAVTVLTVVYATGTATLTTWPAMSPGVLYTVTAEWGGYGYDTATFTPSSAYVTGPVTDDYRNVAAVANALGQALYRAAGTAECVLAYELAVDAVTAYVDTTLGFADEGVLYIQSRRFTYASKTDAAFHGLAEALPRVDVIGAGTAVYFDEAGFVPDAG